MTRLGHGGWARRCAVIACGAVVAAAVPAVAVPPVMADPETTIVGVAMSIVRMGGESYVDGGCARFKAGLIAGAVGVAENERCEPVLLIKAGGPATVIFEEAMIAMRHADPDAPWQGSCAVQVAVGTAEVRTIAIPRYSNNQGLATYFGARQTVITVPELRAGDDVDGQVTFTCPDAPVVTATFQVRHLPTATDQSVRGVSINESTYATNSRSVTLHPTWRADDFFDAVMISNDGGFPVAARVIRPLTSQPLEWTLEAPDAERMTRVVYLRFRDVRTGLWSETVTDDIVLDTVAPQIVDVSVRAERGGDLRRTDRARTMHVKVTTRPDRTGIALLQWRTPGERPVTRRYTATRQRLTVTGNAQRLVVRVRDGAGNWSRWTPAR